MTHPRERKFTVNWNTVCKSKDHAGLGIKKARDQNLALLTKLDWNLTFKDGSFWVDIIRDKT